MWSLSLEQMFLTPEMITDILYLHSVFSGCLSIQCSYLCAHVRVVHMFACFFVWNHRLGLGLEVEITIAS